MRYTNKVLADVKIAHYVYFETNFIEVGATFMIMVTWKVKVR